MEDVRGFLSAVYEQKYQELKEHEAQGTGAGNQVV
jgi:hypothetical protein